MKQPAVYILASARNGTLYIGVTSNLVQRIWQHRENVVEGFTQKYNVKTLVWYELHETMESAIAREKALKKWNRAWKLNLIERDNPQWLDRWPEILGAVDSLDAGVASGCLDSRIRGNDDPEPPAPPPRHSRESGNPAPSEARHSREAPAAHLRVRPDAFSSARSLDSRIRGNDDPEPPAPSPRHSRESGNPVNTESQPRQPEEAE